MTSLDFQSLLRQEKALRRAGLEQRRAPKTKVGQQVDSLEIAPPRQVAEATTATPQEAGRTETSPWFVELVERPLLEMDKARFQYLYVLLQGLPGIIFCLSCVLDRNLPCFLSTSEAKCFCDVSIPAFTEASPQCMCDLLSDLESCMQGK